MGWGDRFIRWGSSFMRWGDSFMRWGTKLVGRMNHLLALTMERPQHMTKRPRRMPEDYRWMTTGPQRTT